MPYPQAATLYLTAKIPTQTMRNIPVELIVTTSGDCEYLHDDNKEPIVCNSINIIDTLLAPFILPTAMIRSTSSIGNLSKVSLYALNSGIKSIELANKDLRLDQRLSTLRNFRGAKHKLRKELPINPIKLASMTF